MPSRRYIEIQVLIGIAHVRSTAKMCLGQVVTIVSGHVVTTITTPGRFVLMAQPASCMLKIIARTQFI